MNEGLKQLLWVGGIVIFLIISLTGMYFVFENTIQNKERPKELPIRYTAQHGNSAVPGDIETDGD